MTHECTKTYNVYAVMLLLLTGIASSGCSTEPKRVEADYGNSVNQMVQAATYDPEAAASTESKPVIGMDGKRALNTLDAMRSDTERVDDFNDVFNIELSND